MQLAALPPPFSCDVYLTHDSVSVRKAHNSGRNHLQNVRDYYQSLDPAQLQAILDSVYKHYDDLGIERPAVGPAYGARGGFGGGGECCRTMSSLSRRMLDHQEWTSRGIVCAYMLTICSPDSHSLLSPSGYGGGGFGGPRNNAYGNRGPPPPRYGGAPSGPPGGYNPSAPPPYGQPPPGAGYGPGTGAPPANYGPPPGAMNRPPPPLGMRGPPPGMANVLPPGFNPNVPPPGFGGAGQGAQQPPSMGGGGGGAGGPPPPLGMRG